MKRLQPFLLAFICLLLALSSSRAQQQTITRYVSEGGGVLLSTGGGYALSGTLGQPVAGFLDNSLSSQGFWTSIILPNSVHEEYIPADQSGYSITPNPQHSTSTLTFTIPSESVVSIEITDALGQTVRTLGGEQYAAGSFALQWDGMTDAGAPASSGSYQSRLIVRPVSSARTVVSRLMIMLMR
ncbi:MAG: FlgD immunoglobulin-like domain containing protein [Candidatus Kapaibacterium sp.]